MEVLFFSENVKRKLPYILQFRGYSLKIFLILYHYVYVYRILSVHANSCINLYNSVRSKSPTDKFIYLKKTFLEEIKYRIFT